MPERRTNAREGEAEASPSSLSSEALEALWAAIAAAGPREIEAGFDPMTVDDVLAAERAPMQYERRKSFVAAYAWAIPTRAAIERIAEAVEERRLLEVGAGTGLWARLLEGAGVSVVASEPAPPPVAYFPIEVMDGREAVRQHGECEALLLCWPPFKDVCATAALEAFEGDRVIYVGDERFTAEASFQALLQSSWEEIERIELPSWPGTRDAVRIYVRRAEPS